MFLTERIAMNIALASVLCQFAATACAQSERKALLDALHFHASFDGGADAKVATGDGRVFTADSLERKQLEAGITRADVSIAKGAGKYGDCLRFADKAKAVIWRHRRIDDFPPRIECRRSDLSF